ncbi:hypothetical protein Pstr01_41660 [Pseudomonas straminea]|nr:hypothetical protein Pstr01_41660 [Pseudomonas straminea]
MVPKPMAISLLVCRRPPVSDAPGFGSLDKAFRSDCRAWRYGEASVWQSARRSAMPYTFYDLAGKRKVQTFNDRAQKPGQNTVGDGRC